MNRPLAHPHASADFRARFSTREFMAMVAADAFGDMRIELVQGELERMNPPFAGHGFAQSQISAKLYAVTTEAVGVLALAKVGIDLGDDTVRACDVAIARTLPSERRLLRPDELLLVVEIADETLARDLGPKAHDYARGGIATYWVVDLAARAVTVMQNPIDGDYTSRTIVSFGEALAVPGTDAVITL